MIAVVTMYQVCCDADGCDRFRADDYGDVPGHAKIGYHREIARDHGWHCGDDGDYCPDHTPPEGDQ